MQNIAAVLDRFDDLDLVDDDEFTDPASENTRRVKEFFKTEIQNLLMSLKMEEINKYDLMATPMTERMAGWAIGYNGAVVEFNQKLCSFLEQETTNKTI